MFMRSQSLTRRLEVGLCSPLPKSALQIVTSIAYQSCFQALERPNSAIETNFEICELIEAARNG